MKDPITLVRRKLVFEEIVMEREEFEKLDYDNFCELEMGSEIGSYLDETEHVAYEGDVTSYLDNCVTMLTQESDWCTGKPTEYIQTANVSSYIKGGL